MEYRGTLLLLLKMLWTDLKNNFLLERNIVAFFTKAYEGTNLEDKTEK